ncbi:MAG: hypothetical protein GU359_04370 [Desulfurococcales archaeon]|jgi:hypothetical protein|nr:hypothetical protein [Desulfurococcales archaeon]
MSLPDIDISNINSALYILIRLPTTYWLGITTLVLGLFLNPSLKSVQITILSAMLSVAYIELPRLMYENVFQIEYFHQAQVFHALNYGLVTDPKYPFPVSDVAHAILSAIFINVTDLEAVYVVSHLLPIILRLILAISMLCIVAGFRTSKYYLYLLTIAPLYVVISDTEPSFTNHYIFVLPLYGVLIYLLTRLDDEERFELYILLIIVVSAITISHIYFATLIIISLFTYLLFNNIVKKVASLKMTYILASITIFLIWHGYASDWSIQKFYAELNYALLPAIDRFLSFEINPLIYVYKAQERYGSIPIKIDYSNILFLKNIMVLSINLIILFITFFSLLYLFYRQKFRKVIQELLIKRTIYIWSLSAIFLAIYGATGTAHPQRVLESFIIPNYGVLLLLLRISERRPNTFKIESIKTEKVFKNKTFLSLIKIMILIAILASVLFIPFKIITYWGTSLTYIGFSQKYIHEAMFIATYGDPRTPIHYVGSTPYWFLTEIISKWPGLRVYDLNGPEGEMYFTETLINIRHSLNISESHYIYNSLSSLYAMRAKYFIEPLLSDFIENYEELINKINVIYTNSLTEFIIYVS